VLAWVVMVRWLVVSLVFAASCGRGGFDPIHSTGPDSGVGPPSDAALSAIAQRAYLKASNSGLNDFFGNSVALSADGSTLAVAAYREDGGSTGINGNQADKSGLDAGAVYVFTRDGGSWTQQAYVKASNADPDEYFGTSVALSTDGSTLAVGAKGEYSGAIGIGGNQNDNTAVGAGAVYVFTRAGTTWTQEAYVKASNTNTNDSFGASVALSGDGSTLAVGAPMESSSATGIGGNQADNSAMYAGAVYVFTRAGATWTQQAYVKASNTGADDWFGKTVALSDDGSTLAVATWLEDSAAVGINGAQADNSALNAGAVYVFTRAGTSWSQEAYLKASNTETMMFAGDAFGYHIALSGDGSTLAVGANGEDGAATGVGGDQADNTASGAGAVYVFGRVGTTWNQEAYVKASNTAAGQAFGSSVALTTDGATLAVGATSEDSSATGIGGDQANNGAVDSGAVYVFTRAGTWSQQAYVKASNTRASNWFGYSVAVSGDGSTLAVGAYLEASAGTGIDGNQADSSLPNAGACYLYQ